MLRLIVGLGNPGSRYQQTRHNVGQWFVESIAKHYGTTFKTEAKFFSDVAQINHANQDYWLLRPTTYMNQSGRAVSIFTQYYHIPIEEILVAHDELDLPVGTVKFKQGGGHAGHNGLRDIIHSLNDKNTFQRLRIGVGRPASATQSASDYVLSPPTRDEKIAIELALDKAISVFPDLLTGNFQQAMNKLHQA